MKKANIMRVVCVAGLSAVCAWGLAGCSSSAEGSSGAVAATVNGTEISEDSVTNYIQSFRTEQSLDTEDAWGKWMAENNFTPESVREQIIDAYAKQELAKQGVKEKGITVDDSEVQSYVDKTKANYDSDEKWQKALSDVNMTEDSYRSSLKEKLEVTKLQDSFAPTEEPTEEEMLEFAQMYSTYYDGAKRSSHILFESADEATAQSVLDQINAGSLDFAEAAKQYSKDSSAEKGGDVGWDKTNSFVPEYTEALNGLEKDQVSGLVTSEFGIHIIKCTDVFTAPEELTSLDQFPADLIDIEEIKAGISDQKKSEAYQKWLEEYQASADIQINPMPEGLPYWVDMAKYPAPESTTGTEGAGGGATAGATDGAAAGTGDASTDAGAATGGATDGAATDAGTEASAGDNASDQPAEQPAESQQVPEAA